MKWAPRDSYYFIFDLKLEKSIGRNNFKGQWVKEKIRSLVMILMCSKSNHEFTMIIVIIFEEQEKEEKEEG